MKTWLYLPLVLLVFVFTGCTKTTNEVVIPNKTIYIDNVAPNAWVYDNTDQTYNLAISVPELKGFTRSDGVIVSMGRYGTGGAAPTEFEMLPEVFAKQSYNVLHNDQQVFVQIKGIDGAASAAPTGTVAIKIVLIPSVVNN